MGYSYYEKGPTADLTVDSWGDTLEEAFRQAAFATFDAMTPLSNVKKSVTREFKVEGDDVGALLFNFLDELLYIFEVDFLVFSDYKLEISEDHRSLKAICWGELFRLGHHEQRIAIKAVTFHLMNIEKKNDHWELRVVLDT